MNRHHLKVGSRLSRRASWMLGSAVAASAALPLAFATGADAIAQLTTPQYYFYQVANNTGADQSSFNVALSGDVTTGLGNYVNSFISPTASSTYTSSPATTTVTFASNATPPATIQNGATGSFGFEVTSSSTDLPAPNAGFPEAAYWGSSSTSNAIPLAGMYENLLPLSSPVHITDPYMIWEIDVANSATPTQTTTEYYETTYNTLRADLLVSNNSANSEVISNAGYYAPSTLTNPLTLAQIEALPSSDFTAPESLSTVSSQLTYTLAADSSLEFLSYPAVYAPEPASAAMFGVAAAGLLLLRRRRA
ncbi:MAG: PEP-CTERM sorting domain-containing protein [Phycisphaerae bacterium]